MLILTFSYPKPYSHCIQNSPVKTIPLGISNRDHVQKVPRCLEKSWYMDVSDWHGDTCILVMFVSFRSKIFQDFPRKASKILRKFSDLLQGTGKKIHFKRQSLKYFIFIAYLCSFSAMSFCHPSEQVWIQPGLDFAVPWAGYIRSVCHSHDLCLWTSLGGTQVLQLLGTFPFSLIPEPVVAALPVGLNHFYYSCLCTCHSETGHLGGTGVSSKWWEGVNWLYFSSLFYPPGCLYILL